MGKTSPNIYKNRKYGTIDSENIRRQCQRALVLDLLGGTRKICELLSFFISWAILWVLLAAGTSSEGDGTTRRFRGYLCDGVFSLG